ncbi:MAG: hypothetical protein QNK03_15020 [Myxococcota bacterium]|nr:hypothetical protein [Myxococcota bacterium]
MQKRDTELWAHVGDPRLRSLALTSWIRCRICAASLEQMDAEFVAIGELVDAQLADAT